MIPAEFDYAAPTSLQEALQLLSEHPDDGKLLAGGHSLVPLMKLRLAQPGFLIDLSRVAELRGISMDGQRLRIGAMTTHAEIAASSLVQQSAPALAQAAQEIGDRQVRVRGTIGGSLAHSDPAADFPAVMLALDAEISVQSASGQRTISAESFLVDLLTTALAPDEILTSVSVAAAPRSAYVKFPNPASHYAIAGVCAALAGNGAAGEVRIGVTGVAPMAFRAAAAEASLKGKALSTQSIADAAAVAYDGRELLGDIHASSEYRAALVNVLTRRALEKIPG
jgi:carbon-monoxide dehydrogenase medium subunit